MLLGGLISFHRLGIIKPKCDSLGDCVFDFVDSFTVDCYNGGELFVVLNGLQLTLIYLKMSF